MKKMKQESSLGWISEQKLDSKITKVRLDPVKWLPFTSKIRG